MQRWVAMVCVVVSLLASAETPPAETLPPVRFELVGKVDERPVLITHDNTGRTFVVEQPGRVWLLKDGKLDTDARPYLDLSDQVYPEGECGLLGLAFHPKFSQNGLLYINCVRKTGGKRTITLNGKKVEQNVIHTLIAEFHADPPFPKASTVDPKTLREVMRIDQPYENHNGGMVSFGPDGMLYIGMGDGGNQRDPDRNGQNLNVLLAKMLRIDVDHRDPGLGYAIPKDNPFVGQPGARPEIWCYGLRNPWRFTFDRQTGLCYAADVGEDRWEEIDIIRKGANYGWSVREGLYPFNRQPMKKGELKPTTPPDDPPSHPGFADPIKVYWHDLGMSITGGHVYRGRAIPQLQGWYLYADYSKGTFWGLKYDEGTARVTAEGTLTITNAKEVRPILPSGFGEDTDGELYVASHQDGKVWKIVPAPPALPLSPAK